MVIIVIGAQIKLKNIQRYLTYICTLLPMTISWISMLCTWISTVCPLLSLSTISLILTRSLIPGPILSIWWTLAVRRRLTIGPCPKVWTLLRHTCLCGLLRLGTRGLDIRRCDCRRFCLGSGVLWRWCHVSIWVRHFAIALNRTDQRGNRLLILVHFPVGEKINSISLPLSFQFNKL